MHAYGLHYDLLRRMLFGAGGILSAGMMTVLQRHLAVLLLDEELSPSRSRPRLIVALTERAAESHEEGLLLQVIRDALHSSTFHLQPLRERREDLPALVALLTEQLVELLQQGPLSVTDEAVARLTEYDW